LNRPKKTYTLGEKSVEQKGKGSGIKRSLRGNQKRELGGLNVLNSRDFVVNPR